MSEPTPGEVLRQQIVADLDEDDRELDPKESLLLDKACVAADNIALLEESIEQYGVMVPGPKGNLIVNPAVVEARLQSHLLANLLGRLNLDGGPTAASEHGRKAANIRWHGRSGGRRTA